MVELGDTGNGVSATLNWCQLRTGEATLTIAFGTPIQAKLRGEPNPMAFQSVESLEEWLEPEWIYWSSFNDKTAKFPSIFRSRIVHMANILTQLANGLKTYRNMASANPNDANLRVHMDTIQKQLSSYAKSRPFGSVAPRAIFLREILDEDPTAALMVLGGWNSDFIDAHELFQAIQRNDETIKRHLVPYIKGVIVAELFDRGCADDAKPQTEALSQMVIQWERDILGLHQQRESALGEIKAARDTLGSEATSLRHAMQFRQRAVRRVLKRYAQATRREINEFKEFYRSGLLLEKPVDYWAGRASEHRDGFVTWGLVFAGLVGIAAILLATSLPYLTNLGHEVSLEKFSLTPLFIVGVPTFLGIWILRIVARLLHLSVVLRHDAQERVTMAQTYIALLGKGAISEQERALVLNALFRPAAVSNAEDSAPPYIWNALMDRAKGK
jgi:hypothetical protein